jgi:S-adenosylmethionine:tRNA ribosyltransferase-isomerase
VLLEDLDFPVPQELIAQSPLEPRDSCRLMHLRSDGTWNHMVFSDLPNLLRSGDTLVFNDSRVLPGRLRGRKPTGGQVELLFLRPLVAGTGGEESWETLARPSHRLRVGGDLELPGGERLELREPLGDGRWIVAPDGEWSVMEAMNRYGKLPLPPYIKEYPREPSTYQTVYAAEPGSAAAPTAGLHFTAALLRRLQGMGIKTAFVTLHVGLDTFQPIREARVETHRIHREAYSVSGQALADIQDSVYAGGRLVAVGTTATRVLETLARDGFLNRRAGAATESSGVTGSTEIFITPGYRFRAVGALLTNFHLPRSSVLALAMAFAGRRRLLAAYAEAVSSRYRFFSFGDAMFIDDGPRA